jgi:hypothetical protein
MKGATTFLSRPYETFIILFYFILFFGGQRPLVPLLLLGPPFVLIILFGSTTLLTGVTGNSLHMQWPLTSQSHGSVSPREQLFFFVTDQTPRSYFILFI